MPKFADYPWPMHGYLLATQLTLHTDVTPAHGLRKKDAGIFPRAVSCVHPVGGRVVEVRSPQVWWLPPDTGSAQQGHVEP